MRASDIFYYTKFKRNMPPNPKMALSSLTVMVLMKIRNAARNHKFQTEVTVYISDKMHETVSILSILGYSVYSLNFEEHPIKSLIVISWQVDFGLN